VIAGIALRADPQDAGLPRTQPPYVFLRRPDVLEDPPGCGKYTLSGGSHDHALSHAQEERRPQPFLDRPQPMADRRLGPMQVTRRPGDAAGRGDRGDHPEISKLEVHDQDSLF
jgi:hypothetical protein